MQGMYLLCFVIAAAILVAYSQTNPCAGKADNPGNPNVFGCYSKTHCENQTLVVVQCPKGEVMERDSYSCKNKSVANTACGSTPDPDCTGKADGKYGDVTPNCQTFYWCSGGQYHPNSRQYCPASLVWDSVNDYCNWPGIVLKPCGDKDP